MKTVKLDEILSSDKAEEILKGISFEAGIKLLEELVAKVESGSLELDAAIGSYEKGVALIARLRELLSGAEDKLRSLQGSDKAKSKSKSA